MRVLTDTFFEAEKYFIYYNGEKQEINANLIFPELKKCVKNPTFRRLLEFRLINIL